MAFSYRRQIHKIIDALALFMVFLCENVSTHGGRMEGTATGEHKAVRLEHLPLDVAIDLNTLLRLVTQFSNGDGQITFSVANGNVGNMEMTSRLLRKRTPRKAHLQRVS